MRRLIAFLYQNRLLFAFLILEAISIGLTVRSHSLHRSILNQYTQTTTGAMLEFSGDVSSYFSLKDQNERLNEENARLRSSLKQNYFNLYTTSDSLIDTLMARQYIFRAAKVVNNSFTKRDNFVTLNKGRIHGMKPGMGVICEQGMVGIIKDVSEHYSTAITLLHSRFSTSGALGITGHFGTISWPGSSFRFASLSDLPSQVNIKKGQAVVSTSYSGIFPPNTPIGKVEDWAQSKADQFIEARIALDVDFSSIRHVEVVENILLPEKIELFESSTQP